MQESVKEQNDVEKLKDRMKIEEEKLNEKKAFVNSKLANIEPILETAKQAVGALGQKELSEIRSLPQPPVTIRFIMQGVLLLMGLKDSSWKGAQNFLGRTGVKEQIISFNTENVDKKTLEEVKKFLSGEASEAFKDEVAARSSKAALSLARWIKAQVEYTEVLQMVGPLKKEMEILQKSQDVLNQQLNQCESKILSLNEKVKKLQEEYEQKTQEAEALKFNLQQAEKTLSSAQNLLSKLGGEKERWEKQVEKETKELKELPYLSLLAAAFMIYLPDTPENIRTEYIEKWKQMLGIKQFAFRTFMSTESEMLKYKAEGLPGDELSIENAIVILESIKYPLIIDPSKRATEWLKTNLMNRNIECTTLHDTKFSTTLELAVRFGKTLMIEEVDRVEPILYPLLRNEIIVHGSRKSVLVGDKIIDYSDDFKLFMITRNPNIVLSPDSIPLVTVVNFTVTKSGLEGQLLSQTLQHENPEIEEKKSTLLKKEEDSKIQLSELEKQLLNELALSKGNLLENDALITKLAEIKKKSQAIVASLSESSKVMMELETKRNQYKPFAEMGSNLFFLINDLRKVNHMYQFSLSSFLKLFDQALTTKLDKTTDINLRISLLKQELQRITYYYISRSLFKEDRLLFGMHMIYGIFSSMFTTQQWDFFTGNIIKEQKTNISIPTWVPNDRAKTFQLLITSLPETTTKLQFNNSEIWKRWIATKDDVLKTFPVDDSSITNFEKIIVAKILRPDQLFNIMNDLVCKTLDIKSTSSSLKLSNIYKQESICTEPILLITTPGTDPSQELREMALQTVGYSNFIELAMGQGQTEEALMLIRKCTREGKWLFLKNLHLVIGWLPMLEKEIATLADVNDNFRLWLTTESQEGFPLILLQQSLKVTFEAPPGVKQNILRTFDNIDSNEFNQFNKTKMKLLLILAWFHAIVQERRSYIPQGWTKFYEFSFTDFRSSSDIISSAISNSGPEWKTIFGLLENAIYGGRVDNKYDLKVLQSYLKKFFDINILNNKLPLFTKGIYLPDINNSYEEYLKFIEKLPEVDQPELFGLPPNSDKLVQISRSNKIIEKLKMILSSIETTGHFNKEEWSSKLIPLVQMWNSLVQNQPTLNQPWKEKSSLTDPVESFFAQELENSLHMIKFIDNDIQKINEVIKGIALIDSTIQDNSISLMNGIIPERWQEKWENGPANNIQLWLSEVVNKTLKLKDLYSLVQGDKLFSRPLEFTNLFHPHIFFNALKQLTARKTGVQLDDLSILTTNWGQAYFKYISSDSTPALVEIPQCEVFWVTEQQLEKLKQGNEIPNLGLSLPVYYSPTRDFTVVDMYMPIQSSTDIDKYILTGSALFIENYQ
ncbi:hypothetical protein ABK040_013670 [Willaertia magna]